MIQRLKPKSEFSLNVLTLMIGTTIAQAIPIAISPILTRIYTPEDFGLLALYMAVATIVAVISTGRYELAIMLPLKDEDAANVLALSITIAALMSLISLVLIWIFNSEIVGLLGNQEIGFWLYFIPLSIMLVGAYNSFTYWSNRKKQYKRLSQSKVVQSSSMGLAQITLGLAKGGGNGLIMGWLVGQFVALIALVSLVWKNDKDKLRKLSRIKMIGLARHYKNFPLINSWSALLNTASLQVPIILLSVLFNVTVTGFFSLAQRILQMPMSLLGAAIGQVYFEEAAKLKNNKPEIRRITLDIHKKLLMVGLLPVTTILLFGDDLFALFFSEPWREAGEYAQLISIWIFFVFVSSPLSHLMTIYEKHIESVLFNMVLFLSRIITFLLGWWLIQDAYTTIAIYAVVGAVVWLGFIFYLMKIAGIGYLETAKHISVPLIIVLVLAWLSLVKGFI
jgi:lipopolysaccharide exporter